MTIPTLDTERLTLRGHTLDDFAESLAMWSDPAVVRYIGGRPFNGEEVWARLMRYVGQWALLGFGYWVVVEKATRRFVGEVGFIDARREIVPSFAGMPEIGWCLATRAQGRGFATEAVGAILDWGDRHFGPVPTVCLIHPENRPSLRLAEKSGYRMTTTTTYKDQPAVILERGICSERSHAADGSDPDFRGDSP